jgi:hypothetical protein
MARPLFKIAPPYVGDPEETAELLNRAHPYLVSRLLFLLIFILYISHSF